MPILEESQVIRDSISSVCFELISQEITTADAIEQIIDVIKRELEKQSGGICGICYNRGYSIETKKKSRNFLFCDCGRGFQLRHWIDEFYISRDELVKFARDYGK